ncbi:MAG TPA: S8 family serine peptidase [Methanotrichaceae archaeon]|nr:S8 family serine peptidase [Methanotrichaceae archaeon]
MFILLLIGLMVPSGAVESGNPALYEAYKGLEKLGVEDAWKMDYTGKGVKVAVIDGGVDFATPDLIGTQARISNKSSSYYGWPLVIDIDSIVQYIQGSDNYLIQSQYADTNSTNVSGYQVTGTSKSGIYHIGDHPDINLDQFYGQPVKVLVVDEKIPNVYDTVYVDLNNNHDFRDDKPCRKGDEISYWDKDDDGYPDESGGMIYFIADGRNPLPISKILYGEKVRIPKNGELVAFHYDESGHGTMCASIIAAQGRNVKGIAPDSKIITIRNSVENDMVLYLLASIGIDGVPGTGDEADIISRSGGFSYLFNKGADEGSAFLEYLTTNVSPSTTIVNANGNDGAGYGTCISPSSKHTINVGAIYDLWWNSSSYSGDVVSFSSRGPNALGQAKPNVLAVGYLAPRVLPLSVTHNGKAAWNNMGGGTSGATPHAAAVVALIYQAYKDTHGKFPTSEKARDILMSSATDIDEEVLAQGSGIINARRAVEIASGTSGVLIEPALLVTGPVKAGSTLEFNFTITNYSGKSIQISPQTLIRDKKKELALKSSGKDILFSLPKDMLDCDLLKVSSYYPREAKSTKLERYEGYDLFLYDWRDSNGDGYAQDAELEAIVSPPGDMGLGFTSEARIHNPSERTSDGVIGILKMRGEIGSDEIQVVLEAFNWRAWNIGIEVDEKHACVSIPAPNTTGVYQGRILLEYGKERQCIPISFSVYRIDEIRISNMNDIYENAKIYGRFEAEPTMFWDTRAYPVYHQGLDLASIEVAWEDQDTDIDVYLYGQDIFNASKIWKFPVIAPVDLPKLSVQKENGNSMRISGINVLPYGDRGVGGSYSNFYTSSGKNREVIVGELTDGLNLVVLHQVVSAGKKYGENVTVNISIMPLNPIALRSKAGDLLNVQAARADCIIGFSTGEEIEGEDLGFSPLAFWAEDGDIIVISSNDTVYFPQIFFDSNQNGKLDWGPGVFSSANDSGLADELIFGDRRSDEIDPYHTDIIPIHKKGTYLLLMNNPYGRLEFYHLKDRYMAKDGQTMVIKTPEQSGSYLGIAEKDGILIPVTVKLLVEPGDPVSIGLKFDNITERNESFQVELELQDRFGNLVEKAAEATIEFGGVSQKVRLVNGLGFINLTAPPSDGIYQIVTKSRYGVTETEIKIAEMAPRKTGDFNISSDMAAQVSDETPQMATKQPKETAELPEKVQSVSIKSTDGNISLSWPQSEGADRYNVYRLKYGNFEKAAEVNVTEYAMAAEFWKSYTFRVSAVSNEGDEGEPSDPVAIVVTP